MTVVRGDRVLLRGFRPEEIDDAMARVEAVGTTVRVGEATERERMRRWRLERSGGRNDWEVLFAIEAGGRLVSEYQGRCSEQAMPPGVWEIGLELWDETDRGQGIGREAVDLLTSHLFEREGAIRVQATTDPDNRAMRGVLERLGFEQEGVLRGFMPSPDGAPRDHTMYGLTRNEWENEKGSWTRTS